MSTLPCAEAGAATAPTRNAAGRVTASSATSQRNSLRGSRLGKAEDMWEPSFIRDDRRGHAKLARNLG